MKLSLSSPGIYLDFYWEVRRGFYSSFLKISLKMFAPLSSSISLSSSSIAFVLLFISNYESKMEHNKKIRLPANIQCAITIQPRNITYMQSTQHKKLSTPKLCI